ncbi:ATP-binding protein [Sulfitobacter mediterraneus]|uniref:ATP-binding protein n=1 Tax=Sulfitobacter mediterraneus TaxID=83219 RepID=UPI002491375E|nr:ATP-binding protein [Sulfitobacter mediterraneus]
MPPRQSIEWLQAAVLLVFLSLSYGSFLLVHIIAQSRSHESFQILVDQSLVSLDRRFEEYSRVLDGVSGLVLGSDLVTAKDMTNYANALKVQDNMIGLDAVGLAMPTNTGEGLTGANVAVKPGMPVVQYVEPSVDHGNLVGLAFSKHPELFTASQEARRTRQTLAVRDIPGLSAPDGQPLAILIKPIFRPFSDGQNAQPPSEGLVGFAIAVMNIENAFKSLTAAQSELIELKLVPAPDDLAAGQGDRAITTPITSEFTGSQTINKFGQSFALSWSSTKQFDSSQPFRARWIVLILGFLITALVSMMLRFLMRKNQTIALTVAQKTRDLETQDKEKRSILENAMLAIVSVTPAGRILHSNDAAQKLLLPAANQIDLTRFSVGEVLPDYDLCRSQGRTKLQLPPAGRDAEPWIVEIEKNTWFTADGETRFTLMMRDITQSERHTQEIAKTEQRWNLALTSAEIGVFDLDLRDQTSVVSETWKMLLQRPEMEGGADPYSFQIALMHEDDVALLKEAEAACIDGSADRASVRFRVEVAQNEWRWMQSDAVVVERSSDGTAIRMLGIQMDITESYKLEQLKRDFVATVSHELRTPLTSIKGALGLLQVQLKDVDTNGADRLIEIASSNSERLVSLVNDILDMEKINAGSMAHDAKPERLSDIMALASKHTETYASQWNVQLSVEAPEGEQDIWTDKKRTIQVLSNLLSNACKFAHSGTTVRLSAEFLPDCARISVINQGIGIQEEFRDKVFQPFSQADCSDTRQRGGTGLGLNISRQLIESMGGQIGFDSEPGKETVFWFTCPLAKATEIAQVA